MVAFATATDFRSSRMGFVVMETPVVDPAPLPASGLAGRDAGDREGADIRRFEAKMDRRPALCP